MPRSVARALPFLVPLMVAATGGTAAAAECPDRVERDGPWSIVRGPEGLADLKVLAVDADRPERLFVSDGAALARSADGGCTWTEVLRLSSGPAPEVGTVAAPQSRILDIAIARGTGRVAVAAAAAWTNLVVSTGAPEIHVSDDGGQTFARSVSGLPTSGVPGRVAFAPSDANRVLVALEDAATSISGIASGDARVARSTDGGRTWAVSEPIIGGADSDNQKIDRPGSHGLAIDPLNPERVWTTGGLAADDSGLLFSEDGGATFRAVGPAPVESRRPQAVVVEHLPGRPASIRTFNARYADSGASYLVSSDDDGATWGIDPADGLGPEGTENQYRGWAATAGTLEDLLVTTGNGNNPQAAGLFQYVPAARAFARILTPEVGVLHETAADHTGGAAFLALDKPGSVVRYAPQAGEASPGGAAAAAPGTGTGGPESPGAARPDGRPAGSALRITGLARRGRIVRVRLTGHAKGLRLALRRGRRTLATARLSRLEGAATVRLTARVALRRGVRLTVLARGRGAQGRSVSTVRHLRVR